MWFRRYNWEFLKIEIVEIIDKEDNLLQYLILIDMLALIWLLITKK